MMMMMTKISTTIVMIVVVVMTLGVRGSEEIHVGVNVEWPSDRLSPLRETYEFVRRSDPTRIPDLLEAMRPELFEDANTRIEMIERVCQVYESVFPGDTLPRLLRIALDLRTFHPAVESRRVDSPTSSESWLSDFSSRGDSSNSRSSVAGWGVALDIKNMEYKAFDDRKFDEDRDDVDETRRSESEDEEDEEDEEEAIGGFLFKTLSRRYEEHAKSLDDLRADLLARDTSEDIKVWELSDIEIQTTQHVLGAKHPLKRLKRVTQDFPSHAKSLTQLRADRNIAEAVESMQNSFPALQDNEASLLTLNGIEVDFSAPDFDVHGFVADVLMPETKRAIAKSAFQRDADISNTVMNALDDVAHKMTDVFAEVPRVDIRVGAKGRVLFVNNLEKDATYKRWSKSLRTLLRPAWGLPQIAKNLYTSITVVDPTTSTGQELLRTILEMLRRGFPVRVGFVFVPEVTRREPEGPPSSSALDVGALAHLARKTHGRETLTAFLEHVSAAKLPLRPSDLETLYDAAVKESASSALFGESSYVSEATDAMSSASSTHAVFARAAVSYATARGLASPSLTLNGAVCDRVGEGGEERWIAQSLFEDMRTYQKLLLEKKLKKKGLLGQLLRHTGSVPTFSALLARASKSVEDGEHSTGAIAPFVSMDAIRGAADLWTRGRLEEEDEEVDTAAADDDDGEQHESGNDSDNNDDDDDDDDVSAKRAQGDSVAPVVSVILVLRSTVESEEKHSIVEQVADRLPKFARVVALAASDAAVLTILGSVPTTSTTSDTTSDNGMLDAVECVILNGWVVTTSDDSVSIDDVALLVRTERARRADAVYDALQSLPAATVEENVADLVMRACAYVGTASFPRRMKDLVNEADEDERLLLRAGSDDESGALLRIRGVLNPTSEAAQRAAPLLLHLAEALPNTLSIRLLMNPRLQVDDVPLKRYYRLALDSNEGATFRGLPKGSLLTMKLETPMPWIVEASRASIDLDNIQPQSGAQDVAYNLKRLLISGRAFDLSNRGQPPNGLQLQVLRSGRVEHDTVVMQNLGYFQLQVPTAGEWTVRIAPGRGSDLYTIVSDENESIDALVVRVDDFSEHGGIGGKTVLRVRKRPGAEDEDLFPAENEDNAKVSENGDGSLLDTLSSMMFGGGESESNDADDVVAEVEDGDDVVHVFSLASGHLYERLMRIMMLSVVKRASVRVKFWLLENFMSPSFKEQISVLAEHYDFDVAFVTYKWPSWLRRQTEKQRIIWGYKILFLDVLFPLDVKKIIYVDADQVVRADIKELRDMDLHGAPYGYTPFCKSNPETLGFQFWNNPDGFWQKHLRGKPYHISALYVVDLEKVRRARVGDQLRAVYDQLSRDANSLANLDQDLPNYAQHTIPIFSLPQEWLWCESWCDDASKKKAKTIDLCNNPLRKEWKLDMAKRVISGDLFQESWIELDEEIKRTVNEKAVSASYGSEGHIEL